MSFGLTDLPSPKLGGIGAIFPGIGGGQGIFGGKEALGVAILGFGVGVVDSQDCLLPS